MSPWILNLLFLLHIELCVFFKIEVYNCKTPSGKDGFCRLQEDCVGANETLAQSKCNSGLVCCPKKKVSERKCNQYAEAVFSDGEGAQSGIEDECAIVALPLIIGGQPTAPKEFPHMAAIGYGKTPHNALWDCGGSLISEEFVLTAAHCLENPKKERARFIKLGATNIQAEKGRGVQILEIIKVIVHPRYNNLKKINDIALLKLSRKARFTPFVRPTCIDHKGVIRQRKALAIGFGKTSLAADVGSQNLMKVELDIVDKKVCGNYLPKLYHVELRESHLCAGVLSGGYDTCQGDSGGPLQTILAKPYCMYNQIGLTSFGSFCGFKNAPATYARVFNYIPWIESIVWPGDE